MSQALALATGNGAYGVDAAYVDGINATIDQYCARSQTFNTIRAICSLDGVIMQDLTAPRPATRSAGFARRKSRDGKDIELRDSGVRLAKEPPNAQARR